MDGVGANHLRYYEGRSGPSVRLELAIGGAFVFQVLLLLWVGWRNAGLLESDGVAYVRLAQYYARGQLDLAVSGYWGPMLSWLMAPLLAVGVDPFVAARLATGFSAVVFLIGSTLLLRRSSLPPGSVVLAVWLSAAASICWSVAWVTPDLLAAGWMILALAYQLPGERARPSHGWRAGCFWGLAYLAKPVGLPLAVSVTLALAIALLIVRAAPLRIIAPRVAATVLGFTLVAGPWITVLSIKYDRLTFSESGRLAHTIIGPSDVDRYHPIGRMIWRPDPGRVTPWEDGSVMPYRHWSPFESSDYFRYQLAYSARNVLRIWGHLSSYDCLSLGLVGVVGILIWICRVGPAAVRDRVWWRVALPVGIVLALHVPVYADQTRYFYCLYPLLLLAILGLGASVVQQGRRRSLLLVALLLISFGIPAALSIRRALVGLPNEAMAAVRLLAHRIQAAEATAQLEPVHSLVGYNGEALAFLLERPWYGDLIHRNAEAYCQADADLVLVDRSQRYVVADLNSHARLVDLDKVLFASSAEASHSPIKAYRRRLSE